mgnify:CR=1 FL=1
MSVDIEKVKVVDACGEHGGPLDEVAQLPHVARPAVFLELLHRLVADLDGLSARRLHLLQEVLHEERNVAEQLDIAGGKPADRPVG